jgi:hypothetical protein
MTNQKHSKFQCIGQLSEKLRATLTSKHYDVVGPSEAGLRFGETDFSNGEPTLRYSQTIAGLLSQRDLDELRRFVLSAPDQQTQDQRKIALFTEASIRLGCVAIDGQSEVLELTRENSHLDGRIGRGEGEDFLDSAVANTGLFACPVILNFSSPKNVIRRLALDHISQQFVAKEIECALAQQSITPLARVRVESMICLDDLLGINPLQVQAALSHETRRMSGLFEPAKVQIPEGIVDTRFDRIRQHQGGWSLNLPQHHEFTVSADDIRPAAFLLIGYFSWDRNLGAPRFDDPHDIGRKRLESLLEGYFAQDACSVTGELGQGAHSGRTRLVVGQPMLLEQAITFAQMMQFQSMALKAKRDGNSFSCSVLRGAFSVNSRAEVRVNMDHRTAVPGAEGVTFPGALGMQIPDDADAQMFSVEHVYGDTWRPEFHIETIARGMRLIEECAAPGASDQVSVISDSTQLTFDFEQPSFGAHALCQGNEIEDPLHLTKQSDHFDIGSLH